MSKNKILVYFIISLLILSGLIFLAQGDMVITTLMFGTVSPFWLYLILEFIWGKDTPKKKQVKRAKGNSEDMTDSYNIRDDVYDYWDATSLYYSQFDDKD